MMHNTHRCTCFYTVYRSDQWRNAARQPATDWPSMKLMYANLVPLQQGENFTM